jgi:hypothetical protein
MRGMTALRLFARVHDSDSFKQFASRFTKQSVAGGSFQESQVRGDK